MKITSFLIAIALVGCSSIKEPNIDQLGDNILVPMPPLLKDCGLTYKDEGDCDSLSNRDLSAEH